MDVYKSYDKTNSSWENINSLKKFEKDGLWGLTSPFGEILLNPVYDQIEICSDYVYVHYKNRHTFYYKDGGSRDCADREDDYRFYENGHIGLKRSDGSVFLPAMYDEIIDWGEDCDVVYVRRDKEYHYFNHNHDEILTEVEVIPEDSYPNNPYNLGEDQNRGVLLCLEPIENVEGNRDCYAYDQWVRLSRIRYCDVRKIFTSCDVKNIPSKAIDHFEDEDTYIYSARTCTSNGEYPITACLEKLKTLGCYNSSWDYLVKISTNRRTIINPHDLYNLMKHFESDDCKCIWYNIALDYDDSLKDGEVKLFQIHYFWDDMGAFLDDEFKQIILPHGSVDDVRDALEEFSPQERKKQIIEAFHSIEFSETRSWDDTKKVLEFLKSEGCDDYSSLMSDIIEINPYWMGEISPAEWQFKKNILIWGLNNGGQLNRIHNGKTNLEQFMDDLNRAKTRDETDPQIVDSIRRAEDFASYMKSIGAITAEEQRKKIESKLDGLSPLEVFKLVETE